MRGGEETEDEDDDEKSSKTGDAAFQKEMRKFMKTMDARLGALEKKKTTDSDDPEKTEDDDDESETKDDGDLTKPEGAAKLSDEGVQTLQALKHQRSRQQL